MTQILGLVASQAYGTTTTWSTVRTMSGTVKVRLTDVTITAESVVTGSTYVETFDYVDYRIGLYRRAGANSTLLASKVIRRYWGQPLGWTTLGSVPSGSYSFQTNVERVVSGGNVITVGYHAWVKATFDASYS